MKFKRQSKILEIIRNHDIETQEELTEQLKQAGFEITQATVSRDIRELNITKVATHGNKPVYAVVKSTHPQISDRFIRVFREGVLHMECAQNIVVIKTLEGMAMAVAAAMDAMENAELIGTIAGDDTIFCAVKSVELGESLVRKLNQIIQG